MHAVRLTAQPLKLVPPVLHCSHISRSRMTFEILRTSRTTAQPSELAAFSLRGDLLIGHGLEVLSDPKTAGEASCSLGREYMVGSDHLGWAVISFSTDPRHREAYETKDPSYLITV